MSLINKKRAFTLAEVMIVILILTILFAAFAPLITKRRTVANRSKYAVWSYADLTNTMNAYYDPGDKDFTGELFFGLSPSDKSAVSTTFLPYSKVIIRSGPVTSSNSIQRQVQFRYGRNSTKGDFAGTWLMDGKNVLLGGNYNNIKYSTEAKSIAKYNLGIGTGALNLMRSGDVVYTVKADNNTALGYYSLNQLTRGNSNVGIGAYSGGKITQATNNTYVGYMAGYSTVSGNENTAIGANAGSGITTGSNNTFIGAFSGAGSNITGNANTAIGYRALASLTSGTYNTAIGYNALGSLTSGSRNTAIGYNACSQVTKGSNKTCIGYNSGPKSGSTGEKYLQATIDDSQRTYIGGTPYNYGGDAVLEIHNVGGTNRWLGQPKLSPSVVSNTTTVINGNLIVRGRLFFTTASTLRAYHYYEVSGSNTNHMLGVASGGGQITTSQTSYTGWSSPGGVIPNLTAQPSDRRLKNIGSKNKDGLNKIKELSVYNYIYKNDKTKRQQVGVIAQDLRRVFSNAVTKDKDGYLQIRWEDMFFASINAIKELDKKIIALTTKVTKVETQISKLEKENSTLKSQVENLALRVEKLKANN